MASPEKPRVKTVKSVPSNETIRLISEARKTLDAYEEEESLSRIMNVPEYHSALTYARERGVRLRFITNITQNTLKFCKDMMSFTELRHLDGIKGGGAVSENECMITVNLKATPLSLKRGDEPLHHHIIQSEQKEMVQNQQYIFDVLWSRATPAKDRINAMETGIDSNFMDIIHNRERAENLLISEIKRAKSEVLIALNSSGYLRHLAEIGLVDSIEQTKSAGGVILVLCPNLPRADIGDHAGKSRQSDYEDIAHLLSDIQRYAEIKSLAGGLTGTLVVIDNKKVIAISEAGIEAAALYSNDRSIVNNFASLFGALWTEKELFRDLVNTKNELATSNISLLAANEQLKNSEMLQKEFVDIAAHELRTPIQPILGMADLLQLQLDHSGKEEISISREELEILVRNAKRLENLSSDLLEVSRIESKSFRLHAMTIINLDETIARVVDDLRLPLSKRGLKIIVRKWDGDEPLQVNVDTSRLLEVFANLLGNAMKFTEHGEIIIATEKKDEMAIVRVSDTGSGIDSEVMPKLFTKFTPKSQAGTGLGLFISKNIIEAHGGKIWAENNKDGRGATFTFALPLATPRDSRKE